ncbi:RNA-binding protein [Klenkia terrae]
MLEEALEHLVKGIVDNPDDVAVDLIDGRRGKTLEVRVHPEDLGKVIGRGGRTAKALRQVMTGVGGAACGSTSSTPTGAEHHPAPAGQLTGHRGGRPHRPAPRCPW